MELFYFYLLLQTKTGAPSVVWRPLCSNNHLRGTIFPEAFSGGYGYFLWEALWHPVVTPPTQKVRTWSAVWCFDHFETKTLLWPAAIGEKTGARLLFRIVKRQPPPWTPTSTKGQLLCKPSLVFPKNSKGKAPGAWKHSRLLAIDKNSGCCCLRQRQQQRMEEATRPPHPPSRAEKKGAWGGSGKANTNGGWGSIAWPGSVVLFIIRVERGGPSRLRVAYQLRRGT